MRYHVLRLEVVDGARSAFPRAVNNLGIVVGYSSFGGLGRPTMWIGRRGFETGTLGGRYGVAEDINDAGLIVGLGTTADDDYRAMSWSDEVGRGVVWFGKTSVQLDTLLDDDSQGLQIDGAEAITDRGQIVAQRSVDQVTIEPLLLTPRPGATADRWHAAETGDWRC